MSDLRRRFEGGCKAKGEGRVFFFEKKIQKTSPGCFARSVTRELNLKRRRHSNVEMPTSLGATRAKHPGDVFCFFFSKKKRFLTF
jgi:hypothetical protein